MRKVLWEAFAAASRKTFLAVNRDVARAIASRELSRDGMSMAMTLTWMLDGPFAEHGAIVGLSRSVITGANLTPEEKERASFPGNGMGSASISRGTREIVEEHKLFCAIRTRIQGNGRNSAKNKGVQDEQQFAGQPGWTYYRLRQPFDPESWNGTMCLVVRRAAELEELHNWDGLDQILPQEVRKKWRKIDSACLFAPALGICPDRPVTLNQIIAEIERRVENDNNGGNLASTSESGRTPVQIRMHPRPNTDVPASESGCAPVQMRTHNTDQQQVKTNQAERPTTTETAATIAAVAKARPELCYELPDGTFVVGRLFRSVFSARPEMMQTLAAKLKGIPVNVFVTALELQYAASTRTPKVPARLLMAAAEQFILPDWLDAQLAQLLHDPEQEAKAAAQQRDHLEKLAAAVREAATTIVDQHSEALEQILNDPNPERFGLATHPFGGRHPPMLAATCIAEAILDRGLVADDGEPSDIAQNIVSAFGTIAANGGFDEQRPPA